MTTSRAYTNRGYQNETNFHNIDDTHIPIQRITPIVLRPSNLEHQSREPQIKQIDNKDISRVQLSKSNYFPKLCLIGFAIGLTIGLALLLAIVIPVGVVNRFPLGQISSTPNWIGKYQMDSSCDTSQCCCLNNRITITKMTDNMMQIAGSITGVCSGFSSQISLSTLGSTTFKTNTNWGYQNILVILGQDNTFLSFVNTQNAMCTATAVRTSYNTASQNRMYSSLFILILFNTIGIMKY